MRRYSRLLFAILYFGFVVLWSARRFNHSFPIVLLFNFHAAIAILSSLSYIFDGTFWEGGRGRRRSTSWRSLRHRMGLSNSQLILYQSMMWLRFTREWARVLSSSWICDGAIIQLGSFDVMSYWVSISTKLRGWRGARSLLQLITIVIVIVNVMNKVFLFQLIRLLSHLSPLSRQGIRNHISDGNAFISIFYLSHYIFL